MNGLKIIEEYDDEYNMKKILVVDNNPVLLKAVSHILEQLDCEVRTAINGLNALEILEDYSPDILFTDLIMPQVSGEQLCKIIRTNTKYDDLFIVVLSAVIIEDLDDVLALIDYDLCIVKGELKELRKHLIKSLELYDSARKVEKQILGIGSNIHITKSRNHSTVTTELLSEKKHLSQMISNLSEGILELNREGKIVSVNNAAATILHTSEESLIGLLAGALPLGKYKELIEDWLQDKLGGKVESVLEILETDPLFIEKKVATASFLSIINKGNCYGVVILRDITRQYRAEEHKNKLDQSFRLVKKMEAMSGMAGGVAHDFNNLLTVICGNLDILSYSRGELKIEEKTRLIGHAQQAAYAATDLVRKISCFSTFGIIDREKFSIGTIISDIIKKYFKRNDANFTLEINNADSLINVDKEQLTTAVHNILINASESENNEPVTIKTSALTFTASQLISGQYVPAGKYVRVDIIDHGIGIAYDDLLKIFDPYFTTKKRGSDKGIGLGLTVVYATLRNHGGYVVVQSDGKSGTTVSLFFPYLGKSEDADAKHIEELNNKTHPNILLMEDEEPLREIGSIMLEHLGYKVTAVCCMAEAIEAFERKEGQFVGAILNIFGEDGEEGVATCDALKKIKPDLKAVASSGAILHPVMADCKSFGFLATLPKPYTMDNLRHALESMFA